MTELISRPSRPAMLEEDVRLFERHPESVSEANAGTPREGGPFGA